MAQLVEIWLGIEGLQMAQLVEILAWDRRVTSSRLTKGTVLSLSKTLYSLL